MQNGHFYSRGRYPTRWHDDNCHPQCVGCNIFLKGNYINYTKYMIDTYGREYVDELEVLSKSTIKISTAELQEMIDKYQST
ncbi:recombination protein NinG, partial [Lacticaseibacillus paracasei]